MKPRLNQHQIITIKQLALGLFGSRDVWVFGSRADESLKGGDIDIYLETEQQNQLLQSKFAFLREFDKACGEQKVDLLINSHQEQQDIFDIAKTQGVKL